MRRPTLHSLILGAAVLAAAGPARAQQGDAPDAASAPRAEGARAEPVEVRPVEVHAPRKRPATPRDLVGDDGRAIGAARALEEPEFATVLRVGDFEGEVRTVADILASTVGVHVRSLGGLGAFSSISVRGGASGHTLVIVDGVPQPQLGAAGADLAQLELGTFSEVELYRGSPPARLGGGALGGALSLSTAVGAPPGGDRVAISAGAGSFGARHLRARLLGGEEGGLAYHLSGGYAGAAGDFAFFNDRGTNLSPDDSEVIRRQNNHYDRGDAVARIRARRGSRSYEAGGRLSHKAQGIPGAGHAQSEHTSLKTTAQQLDGAIDLRGPWGLEAARARVSSYTRLEHQRYRDLEGEIGLGSQDLRYLTASGGGRAHLELPLGRRQLARAGGDGTWQLFDEVHAASGRQGARGMRTGLGVDAEHELHLADERLLVRPAMRVDLLHTSPLFEGEAGGVTREGELVRRTELLPSPRLFSRLALTRALAVKGSAGWHVRAPTVYELFGDRGAIVGNPELRPETGPSADAGLVFATTRPRGPLDRLLWEAVGFAKRPRDAIVFATRSALVAKATNLDGALLYGGEARASLRLWRAISLAGNYTYLETRQRSPQASYDGKRLPHRPAHEAHVRLDAAWLMARRLASVWFDAAYVAGNYLDRANAREVPARALLGAGLKLEPITGLLAGLEVKNLANARVEDISLSSPPRPDLHSIPAAITDAFGHPLPGRAAYVTLTWRPQGQKENRR
jgi:vitamin B12 transporter